jgi:hypothetical protein
LGCQLAVRTVARSQVPGSFVEHLPQLIEQQRLPSVIGIKAAIESGRRRDWFTLPTCSSARQGVAYLFLKWRYNAIVI